MRAAASLIVLRDRPAGPEVLLVRRGDRGDFPGLHVFPGGLLDAADHEIPLGQAADCNADEASALTGGLTDALAHRLAAIRECFEETGVLLGAQADADTLAAWRQRLLSREATFNELVDTLQLRLHARHLGYFSHWITPEGIPRRYDTRFFVARLNDEPTDRNSPCPAATPDGRETVAVDWLRPRQALDAHDRGDIKLIFPTIRNLIELSRWEDSNALLDACRQQRELPAMQPRMRLRNGCMALLLPGDAGYADDETATGTD